MAKKLFCNRERTIPNAQIPSVSWKQILLQKQSCVKNNRTVTFFILETTKYFPKFNANRRSLLTNLRPQVKIKKPTDYLKERVTGLTNSLVANMRDRDLVGLRIRNTENVHD